MNVDWTAVSILGTLLVSLLGIGLTLWRTRPEIRKLEAETGKADAEGDKAGAEAGQVAAQGAVLLLEPLNKRILALESQITTLLAERTQREAERKTEREKEQKDRAALEEAHGKRITELTTSQNALQTEVAELHGGVVVLVSQLEAAGLEPRYKPQAKPKAKTGPLAGGA